MKRHGQLEGGGLVAIGPSGVFDRTLLDSQIHSPLRPRGKWRGILWVPPPSYNSLIPDVKGRQVYAHMHALAPSAG